MKKKLAVLLTLAMSVASFAACGSDETTTETSAAAYAPSVEMVDVEMEGFDLSNVPVEEYVTLGDYKNLTISVAPKAEVDEETVESTTMSYYYSHAGSLAAEDFLTEGTVAEQDVVLMDYEGKMDGEVFDGGSATDATLGIGSGSFIDGFESGLVGVKVGDTVDLELAFPDPYLNNTDLSGKEVVFTVTVKGLVSFTDETVAKFGIMDIATVADYKEAVEAMLEYEAENEYSTNLSNAIYNALAEVNEVTKIPQGLFDNMKELIQEQLESEASYYYGTDAATYVSLMTGLELDDYLSMAAESSAIQLVLFQSIANAEGMEVTQEEIDTFVEEYVATYGEAYGIESVEAFYEYNTAEDVKNALLQDKVITLVNETATIVDAE